MAPGVKAGLSAGPGRAARRFQVQECRRGAKPPLDESIRRHQAKIIIRDSNSARLRKAQPVGPGWTCRAWHMQSDALTEYKFV